MPKTVTSTEAKSRFGELLKWANESRNKVIVKLYGEPAGVLISYAEYEEVERLRKREQKQSVSSNQRNQAAVPTVSGRAPRHKRWSRTTGVSR